MFNLIGAIPSALTDYWYVYDLLLVAVIIICFVVLSVIKKTSTELNAKRQFNRAVKQLEKMQTGTIAEKRRCYNYAKNLLKSALALYTRCIDEKGMYHVSDTHGAIKLALDVLEEKVAGGEKQAESLEDKRVRAMDALKI